MSCGRDAKSLRPLLLVGRYVPAGTWHTAGDNGVSNHSLLLSVALGLAGKLPRKVTLKSWRSVASGHKDVYEEMMHSYRGLEAEVARGNWSWAGTQGGAALRKWNRRFEALARQLTDPDGGDFDDGGEGDDVKVEL